MAVANTLVTVYDLDAARYVRGANQIKAATASTAGAMARAKASLKGLGFDGSQFSSWAGLAQTGARAAESFARALVGMTGALGGFMAAASVQGASIEKLALSLRAVEGSAQGARDAMARLKEIAKLPGLGFQEAVSGYLGLRQTGANAGQAERIIRAFGNANAYNAGGKEEFSRIGLALRQILNSPFLRGQEVLQLSEARIPVQRMLKEAFGTGDTEELKRMGVTSGMAVAALVTAMEKLPEMASGAANAFDNAGDAIGFAMGEIGAGINATIVPAINRFADAASKLGDAGVWESLGQRLMDILMPSAFDTTESDAFEEALLQLGGAAVTTAEMLKNFATQIGSVVAFVKGLVKSPVAHALDWVKGKLGLGGASRAADAGDDPFAQGQKWIAEARAQMALAEKRKKMPQYQQEALGAASLEGLGGDSGGRGAAPVMPRLVSALEENTRSLKEQTASMNRMVFGGGELGQYGVTPVEIGQASKRGRGNVLNITVLGGANEIYDVLTRLERQGRI